MSAKDGGKKPRTVRVLDGITCKSRGRSVSTYRLKNGYGLKFIKGGVETRVGLSKWAWTTLKGLMLNIDYREHNPNGKVSSYWVNVKPKSKTADALLRARAKGE